MSKNLAAIVALWLVAAVVWTAGVSPGSAQSSIKLLVNDEPITTYDVQNRAKFLQLTSRGKAGASRAQEELIEEALKLQEAKRRNVKIDDAEVEEAFGNIATRSKLTPAQLTQALRQAGVDASTLRDRIRAELAWSAVVRARFRATVKISDQDVTEALNKTKEKPVEGEQTVSEYILMPVVFIAPASGGDAGAAKRKGDVEAFRAKFQSCDSALQLAQSMKAVVLKPQTRREESQLSGGMKETLAGMSVGQTTEPERVPEGLQIVAICGKSAIAGQTKASVEARSELTSERGQLMARRYLRDLRSDAVIDIR